MQGRKILVADDDPRILELLRDFLQGLGLQVTSAPDGREAMGWLERGDFDVLLTDLMMPVVDGLQLLEHLAQMNNAPTAIVLTGHGSIESAVHAMRLGAFDYITKPLHLEEIRMVLERALSFRQLWRENTQLRQQLKEKYRFENLVGQSEAMLGVLRLVERVADTDSTILIFGESGTGKELVARALHFNSRRRERPLVVVNCSAIPQDLLESELFGHEQGAFTGAIRARVGKFEAAHGGSLFLDEIGDMSPNLQAKLLRVLQGQEFERVGGSRPVRVDVRIIAATHRDLDGAMREGSFREDLFYRLNVIPIHIPPLRERTSDIPLLLRHFQDLFNRVKGRRVEGFEPEAVSALMRYPWPGNVRELEHLVERMVILHGEGTVGLKDLPEPYRAHSARQAPSRLQLPEAGISLPQWLQETERTLIVQALDRCGWVRNRAAQVLGIHRTTLVEKMRKLGLLNEGSARPSGDGRLTPPPPVSSNR
jgi:DNA-binding NtrC family response regulator